MQIATQIFGIEAAENSLIYFKNNIPAYLVKRFDIKENESKYLQEDFAQIKQVSKHQGENYKYEGSYEEIAELIRKHCGTWKIEIERFFKLIIFNYLISNGDAHLRNFSLIESAYGDFRLSPAYDLLCTAIHTPNEGVMALDLFAQDYFTDTYNILGYYSYADFYAFGLKIGIPENRVIKIITFFSTKTIEVEAMIENSFFDATTKTKYLSLYKDRLKALTYKI
jgi:serine/threonine-protein kinase HipA